MFMIYFGIDILLHTEISWKEKRIALLTNHAATTNQLVPSRLALQKKGYNIVKLFSPEHGLDVQGADGAIMQDGLDVLTGLPVISLYNKKVTPVKEDLQDVDIVLVDIPDIGVRYYTYLWTMTYMLEACALYKKKMIVADRPNPISGAIELSEGPMMDEQNCSSFIGRWHIPLRHSSTLGELALYFNEEKNIQADLEVIRCLNWNRNDFQPSWELEFVPTSPAIQTFHSALLYPGLGLLEATNISEGRGTNKAFQIIGAPWLNTDALMQKISMELGSMLTVQPLQFIPKESKYQHQNCYGILLQVNNQHQFKAVTCGLILIKLIKDLHPDNFQWAAYPTNVNPTGNGHLDKLTGLHHSEALFNTSFNDFKITINRLTHAGKWQQRIHPFLLY